MDHKRRVPRRRGVLGWGAHYLLGAEAEPWAACEILDISTLGTRIQTSLTGATQADLLGRQITIEVNAPVGAQRSARLAGLVRSVVRSDEGRIRLGVEFCDLSDSDRAMLEAIEWILPVTW